MTGIKRGDNSGRVGKPAPVSRILETLAMKRVDIGSQQFRTMMTFHAVAASLSDSVKDVLDLMVANRVLALPVVDDANRPSRLPRRTRLSRPRG